MHSTTIRISLVSEKLGMLIDLERERKEKSKEQKITRFRSRFVEKSKRELGRNFRTRRERNSKLKKKTKSTILNYNLMIQDEGLGGKCII